MKSKLLILGTLVFLALQGYIINRDEFKKEKRNTPIIIQQVKKKESISERLEKLENYNMEESESRSENGDIITKIKIKGNSRRVRNLIIKIKDYRILNYKLNFSENIINGEIEIVE